MHDLSFFLGKNFFGDDSFKNMFVYQPTLSTLVLKEDKGSDYMYHCILFSCMA